jgi:hypothetical protein
VAAAWHSAAVLVGLDLDQRALGAAGHPRDGPRVGVGFAQAFDRPVDRHFLELLEGRVLVHELQQSSRGRGAAEVHQPDGYPLRSQVLRHLNLGEDVPLEHGLQSAAHGQ